MKKLLILTLAFVATSILYAKTPNWSKNIAPIFYANCTNCHNPNGIAPSSFVNYADAYHKRLEIENEVGTHHMPPWPPDPNYRRFAHERILSPKQIKTIMDWVNAGAPQGDTTKAPPKPIYTSIAEIKTPDWTARIPDYTVTDTSDVCRCFVIPSGLLTDKYVTELEVIPGNRSMVHHVLVFEDTSSIPAKLDSADPGPGYTDFGGTGSNTSKCIGSWVPGTSVYKLPAGMGILLDAHTNIIIQIHYPAGSRNKMDSTRVNLKLSNGPLRLVTMVPLLTHEILEDWPFFILANTIKTFHGHTTIHGDYSFLSVGAHMHLIGHTISSWAVTPAGDTIPFISIHDWDFHWQGSYQFVKLQKITAGTVLYFTATYNNTDTNEDNPNHPPKNVSLGEKTTDEMMVIMFAYTPYQPGDENIIQDSALLK